MVRDGCQNINRALSYLSFNSFNYRFYVVVCVCVEGSVCVCVCKAVKQLEREEGRGDGQRLGRTQLKTAEDQSASVFRLPHC